MTHTFEEERMMKRIWRRKWLVIAATIAIFLSVGAAAWATTAGRGDCDGTGCGGADCDGSAACAAQGQALGQGTALGAMGMGAEVAKARSMGLEAKRALQEREERRVLRAELQERLREKMTAEDQALYEQLLAKAKSQREELRQTRQDLRETLQQLRELAKKYLGGQTDTTG